VAVDLPDGGQTRGLFDCQTMAEKIGKYESRHLAGTPSVVLKERLKIGDAVKVASVDYTVRDLDADGDGALTRHFLAEADPSGPAVGSLP
jgi:hypothetical protein